jgi:hypothetical protein
MGRIRTIKPEFHSHEDLSALPPEAHLLASALVNYADDEGYFNAHPVLVKAGTNPLRKDSTTVEEQLAELEKIGYIVIARNGDKCFGKITTFAAHQRVSHAVPSKIRYKFESLQPKRNSPPETLPQTITSTPEPLRNSSGASPEVLRPELNGIELNRSGIEDVSVAARVLSEKVGNLDIRFQEQLARMLRVVCKPTETLEDCVERMAGQWDRYNSCRENLNYPVASSRKFFESGTWHDEKLWPWKEGKQPSANQAKPITLLEKMRQQEAS